MSKAPQKGPMKSPAGSVVPRRTGLDRYTRHVRGYKAHKKVGSKKIRFHPTTVAKRANAQFNKDAGLDGTFVYVPRVRKNLRKLHASCREELGTVSEVNEKGKAFFSRGYPVAVAQALDKFLMAILEEAINYTAFRKKKTSKKRAGMMMTQDAVRLALDSFRRIRSL